MEWVNFKVKEGEREKLKNDAHATIKVLDEDEADNCRCDILDDDVIEKEKANIQKEISELQNKLDKLNNLRGTPQNDEVRE